MVNILTSLVTQKHFKMPAHCQRSASIEAIRRSSVHRSIATPSSRAAMARARNSILTDPYESLDLLRNVLQEDITKKVHKHFRITCKDIASIPTDHKY